VAILDWDVHHGNGTQHHFDRDPHVFFCSIHQHPNTLYPGTGFEEEIGTGDGEGTTLNVTMWPESGDEDYQRAFDKRLLPALEAFKPEFLLVSAGFDAHRADPLAQIELTTGLFRWMTEQAMAVADTCCNGRMVSMLEGGYNLGALVESVQMHVEALANVRD
jgi:acetoin utilization deacetylase AcuC-like enzyme